MTEEPKPVDARSTDIAIVCRQKTEIQALLKHIDRQRKYVDEGMVFRGGFLDQILRIAIVEAGFDFAAHRRASQIMIKEHRPRWMMSVGFSTAVSDDVATGDVCLANRLSDHHGNDLALDLPLEEGKRVHCGAHLATDEPVLDKRSIDQDRFDHPPNVADNVSLAVAQICHEQVDGQPVARFLALRAALNPDDSAVTSNLLQTAFCPPDEPTSRPLFKWLTRLKPDPVRKESLSQLESAAINANRYLLQVIRKLGEDFASNRW